MKTDVYFSKQANKLLIAYQNVKKQNVFLQIMRANYAPVIDGILICDETYNIEKVIANAFEFPQPQIRNMEIGIKKKHIWKPFIQQEISKELDFTIPELCRAKRDLGILLQKLQEILLYVEPSVEGLQTYSHKIRELLILACTELESSFKSYKLGNNKTTNDYVKILDSVNLAKCKISLVGYTNPYKCCPFEHWNSGDPTQSIPWYDAYNKVKHHKDSSFYLATLENCINAIAANVIMFVIRYSPTMLYNDTDVCSNLVRGSLDFRIEDEEDFYIPVFEGKKSYQGAFGVSYPFKNGEQIDYVYDIHELIPFEERPIK